MNPVRIGAPAVLAIIGLGVLQVSAHETWLLPKSFLPTAGHSLHFEMTSGMAFPASGSGIDAERIASAHLLQNGVHIPLAPEKEGPGALDLTATPGAGAACAWVRLNPRILQIDSEDSVSHYLEEIGAPAAVWSAWRESKGDSVWRESYSKLARSYISAVDDKVESNQGGETSCWLVPSDGRLDIILQSNPTMLRAGDHLALEVLFDGEPLSGQAVGLVREGDAPTDLTHSGVNGELSITFASPGRYMLYATHLRRVEGEGFNWESDFVTLTLQVR